MGTITWSLHREFHCSQLCCHSHFLGPGSQWCETRQGHQKSDGQRSLSFVFSEQLPHGMLWCACIPSPAPSWQKGKSLPGAPREAKHSCKAPHAFPSAFLCHSSNALCITATEPDCCCLPKTHCTLPSCVSSSLIFPSIPPVTGTAALSFLAFQCLHCWPQPRAWQLSLGQRGAVGRGWTWEAARESRGTSLRVILQGNFEIGKLKSDCKQWHLKTLSHGRESCAAAPSNSSCKAY